MAVKPSGGRGHDGLSMNEAERSSVDFSAIRANVLHVTRESELPGLTENLAVHRGRDGQAFACTPGPVSVLVS